MSVWTPRLVEIFNVIATMYGEGRSVTRRAIAKAIGVSSPNGVHFHLKRLKKLGAVEYIEGQPGKKQGSLGGNTIVPLYSKIIVLTPKEIDRCTTINF